jgi:hypothetical protein
VVTGALRASGRVESEPVGSLNSPQRP